MEKECKVTAYGCDGEVIFKCECRRTSPICCPAQERDIERAKIAKLAEMRVINPSIRQCLHCGEWS